MKKIFLVLKMLQDSRNRYLAGLLGTAVLMAALDVCLAPILENLIRAAVERSMALFVRGVVLAAVAVAVACLLGPLLQWLYATAMRRAMNSIRAQAHRRVSLGPADSGLTGGEMISILTNDLAKLEELLGDSLVRFLTQLFLALFAIVLMLRYDARIALGVVAAAFVGSLFNGRLAKKSGVQAEHAMAATGRLVSKLTDMASGYAVMKVFHLEARLLGDLEEDNQAIARATERSAAIRGGMDVFNGLLKTGWYAAILLVGLYLTTHEGLTLGAVAAMLQLTGIITAFFFQWSQSMADLQHSLSAVSRLTPILEREPESETVLFGGEQMLATVSILPEPIDGDGLSRVAAPLVVRDLCVESGGRTRLDHLNMTVQGPGLTVLAGPSGSGKTTLFRVLLGLTEPTGGAVKVNGISMGRMTRDELRSQFAYLPQDAWLFDQDIPDNIRAGASDVSDFDIRKAAEQAGLKDFLEEAPERWHSRVGPGGEHLSGGQRQRVALARAIVSPAGILLLDEPTSGLDSVSEQKVLDTLRELARTRTLVVTSHRASVIRQADTVLRLENGRCVGAG